MASNPRNAGERAAWGEAKAVGWRDAMRGNPMKSPYKGALMTEAYVIGYKSFEKQAQEARR